ncbi:MAG TPA: hypothetical protein DDW50_03095 [Firmicutes bacterium]|jgi:hypothetical protein|nr:hypothetical protein [Bacillota bacterium]
MTHAKVSIAILIITCSLAMSGCHFNVFPKNKVTANGVANSHENGKFKDSKKLERNLSPIENRNNDKFISREQAVKIVEDFCADPKGVTVNSFPEEDKFWKGKKFYCIDAVFGWAPAQEFYVDSTNGDIYSAAGGLSDVNKPLNRKAPIKDSSASFSEEDKDIEKCYEIFKRKEGFVNEKERLILNTKDGGVYLSYSGKGDDGNYIFAARSGKDTRALWWYSINPKKEEVKMIEQ